MRMLMLFSVLLPLIPAQTATSEGKVVRVTLYRGQARVTREIPLPARTGSLEIVVPGMPHTIVAGSLYAEADAGTDVRAVRYRTRAVGEEPRDEVRAIDDKITEARDALAANDASSKVVQKRLEYLDKLEGFVAPTAHGDLQKGALDAEALERLVLFGFKQRKEAQDELLKLQREARDIQKNLALLERQRKELHASSSKTLREAVIFVEKRNAGPANATLNYLVTGCGWSPTYNLRADRTRGIVQVEYNAVIQQTTGEDWTGVTFTLSTATPALSAAGPGLAPFTVALTSAAQQKAAKAKAAEVYQSIARRQMAANVSLQNAFNNADNFKSAWDVNRAANDFQTFEIVTGNEVLASVVTDDSDLTDGPSLAYALDVPVSLASRSDTQMVRITRADLKSTFYHVATPVLTKHVYREAEAVNTSGHDLLMGPISVYLEGRFVGRAEMTNVAQGETFVIGLGADARLRARRELADKKEKVQGGNRVIDLKVRLQIENFHGEAVNLRLLDRLPHTDRQDDLRVTLGEMSSKLSEDALYVRTDRPLGILRWDVEVPASAIRSKAYAVDYAYKLEFDRNLALGNPAGQQQREREEFQRLLRKRGAR